MTTHAKRVIIAGALAPLTVPIVSALWSVWYFATSPRSTPQTLVFPDPTQPWEFVILFSLYGIPTAYLSLVLFVPLYCLARRRKLVSYWSMIAAGLLVCLPAAWFYGRSTLMIARTLAFLLPYGVAVAACFLWITRRNAEQGSPGNAAERRA